MSANPFNRNTVREPKLGKIITEDGPEIRRDAVHVAVIPMVAGEDLGAGDAVNITPGEAPVAIRNDTYDAQTLEHDHRGSIGIVDPFLPGGYKGSVKKGERFWLFIYPGQVTTLSHVWTHPAFPNDGAAPAVAANDRQKSENWLRAYAMQYMRYSTPEEGYRKLLEQMESGTITYEGTDMHSRGDLQDADELRHHTEVVLGKRINYDDFEYFSCTC